MTRARSSPMLPVSTSVPRHPIPSHPQFPPFSLHTFADPYLPLLIKLEPTKTYRSDSDHRIYEQSTTNIWSALSLCSNRVLSTSSIPASSIKGVSFDATCSLCVVDAEGEPICVTEGEGLGQVGEGKGERNVILWADHRAEEEAGLINKSGQGVLGFVGGVMSVSMMCLVCFCVGRRSLVFAQRSFESYFGRLIISCSTAKCLAGDGNPKDPLVEESHVKRGFRKILLFRVSLMEGLIDSDLDARNG